MYFYKYSLFMEYAKELCGYFDIKAKIDSELTKYLEKKKIRTLVLWSGDYWISDTIVTIFLHSEYFDDVCKIITALEHHPTARCLFIGGGER